MPFPSFIKENVSLAPLTTLGVGGPARYFAAATTADELREAVAFARGKSLPVFVLGGGSNIVISDQGFPGLVVEADIRGFESAPDGHTTAGAGENWDATVARSVAEGLSGLELLSGIPGKVGGAPIQNIGAYGQEAGAAIAEVEAFDTDEMRVVRLGNAECAFGYRDSIFKRIPGRYCITRVVFLLAPGGAPNISSYRDIAEYFKERRDIPSLEEVRNAVIAIRQKKGMVIMENADSYQSVGSFFKNPIVPRGVFEAAKEKLSADSGGKPWYWELPDAKVKLSAAYLIERAGFARGCRDGAVGISPKHTLALINLGGATAEDVVRLARAIRDRVRERFGITLEPEAQFVGFDANPLS